QKAGYADDEPTRDPRHGTLSGTCATRKKPPTAAGPALFRSSDTRAARSWEIRTSPRIGRGDTGATWYVAADRACRRPVQGLVTALPGPLRHRSNALRLDRHLGFALGARDPAARRAIAAHL